MIRAHCAENWAAMGVNIAIVERSESMPPMILRLTDAGPVWEPPGESSLQVKPTLQLGHEEARALLDALVRHYEGASDMHAARTDLLHERSRVDKLTDAVIDIAKRGAQ